MIGTFTVFWALLSVLLLTLLFFPLLAGSFSGYPFAVFLLLPWVYGVYGTVG